MITFFSVPFPGFMVRVSPVIELCLCLNYLRDSRTVKIVTNASKQQGSSDLNTLLASHIKTNEQKRQLWVTKSGIELNLQV